MGDSLPLLDPVPYGFDHRRDTLVGDNLPDQSHGLKERDAAVQKRSESPGKPRHVDFLQHLAEKREP